MSTLKMLRDKVIAFRDARDWKQFHKPKDMAISLMLEAAEVSEIFQWKGDSVADFDPHQRARIGEELSDVLYWIFVMANDFEIDLDAAFDAKMKKNAEKYPVEKSKGKSVKYTEIA